MENPKLLQKWAGRMIYVLAAYDVLINQFVPQDIQDKYLLYSFGWSLQTWAIIILSSLVITYWWNNRQKEKSSETANTATASSHSTALVNSPVSDSFNNNLRMPTPGFEVPTRSELIHKIGVDTQKLKGLLGAVKYTSLENKHDTYMKAEKTLDKIHEELLPHANLILKDTLIPKSINEIWKQSVRYHSNILEWQWSDEDRIRHIGNVPKDILDIVIKSRDKANELDTNIQSLIDQLIELCAKTK